MRRMLMLLMLFLAMTTIPARAVTLKIATASPEGTVWMEEMHQAADAIKKRTAGRVQFRFYPGGVMGNDASVMRKIQINQLQGGMITGGGLASIYRDSQVYSLPQVFRSYEEVDYVRARMDGLIINGLERAGFISFGLGEGGFAYIMADKPVRDVADLKGQKVWVPAGDIISRSAFEAIGITPISLPLTDVLTGLQTGLINTVAASPIGAIALQWHSRVKYLTDEPLVYLYGTLIIRAKAFNSLKGEDQAAVRDIMGAAFANLNRINRRDNIEALKVLKAQGIAFVSVNAVGKKGWQEMLNVTVQRMGREGVLSKSIMDTLKSHLRGFRG